MNTKEISLEKKAYALGFYFISALCVVATIVSPDTTQVILNTVGALSMAGTGIMISLDKDL